MTHVELALLDRVPRHVEARLVAELRERGGRVEHGGVVVGFACPHCGSSRTTRWDPRVCRWRCASCPAGGSSSSLAVSLGIDDHQIAATRARREIRSVAERLFRCRVDVDLVLQVAEVWSEKRYLYGFK